MLMSKSILTTTFLFSFLAACSSYDNEFSDQKLRSSECPVGCTCVCEPPSTNSSSSGQTSLESSTGSLGSEEVSSSGSSTLSIYDAIAAMGATPHSEFVNEQGVPEYIWGEYPDGRVFRVVYPAESFSPETPGSGVRVLFAFHACGNAGASNGQWDSYHWPSNGNFMVVMPEAQGTCWHTDPSDSTDFYHVQRVIEGVESWSFVNSERRYMQGWSSGAFMTQSAACHLGADALIAGAGSLRAAYGSSSVGDLPVSCVNSPEVYLHHGRFDQRVLVELGQDSADHWAALMGCTNPQPTSEPLDWCNHQYEECDESAIEYTDGCVRYDCAQGDLTWCLDSSGELDGSGWMHSQQLTGRILRDVGEIIFNQ